MSLHDIVAIKQREADVQKSFVAKLAASGLFIFSMLVFLGVTTNAFENRSQFPDSYSLIMIAGGGLYLAYCHCKNSRRIEMLELELLKLKRRTLESQE